MDNLEEVCFTIISTVGTARSLFIEAIDAIQNKDHQTCEQLMKDGEELMLEGHRAHAGLITKEARGENVTCTLLLLHAEDQLMSCETIKIMAEKFIVLYNNLLKD
ncbi:MAG: PTS lactose/cellobiose transporter subunit IIA [Erysipelotrichaceae bacterium]